MAGSAPPQHSPEFQASSFHLIHPHTAKGKSSASQTGRPSPSSPFWTPTLTPTPRFPTLPSRLPFLFFVIIGEPWDWHPDLCSNSTMGARLPRPDFQRLSYSSPTPGLKSRLHPGQVFWLTCGTRCLPPLSLSVQPSC